MSNGNLYQDQNNLSNFNLIKSNKWNDRYKAVVALGELSDKHVITTLVQMLNDRSYRVQEAAVRSLVQLNHEQANELLIQKLNDRSTPPKIRIAIAEAFAESENKKIGPLFSLIIHDKNDNPQVRKYAAIGLANIKYPDIEDLLIKLVEDLSEQTEVRYIAIELLGELQVESSFALLISVLLSKNEPDEIRENAAYALGIIGKEEALFPLIKVLKDAQVSVRVWTANALGHLGDKRAIPALIETLKTDKNCKVREASVYALQELADPNTTEVLIQALKDKYWGVRWNAIDALLHIEGVQAIPLISKALNDRNSEVRKWAAQCLGIVGDERDIPTLTDFIKNSLKTKSGLESIKIAEKAIEKINLKNNQN
ncbi:MAG TPA: HEAT repeat domain-containing protein [Chloroflexia bacterium]|nr:HEAT repeat domain-containing protein [Chloroflexia bacterium]